VYGEERFDFFRLCILVSPSLSSVATHLGMNHRPQLARAGLTFSHGPSNTCRFCAHENAAASKFCSECGKALRVVPCSHCGVVNDAKRNSCYQCHHLLSGQTTDDIAPLFSAAQSFAPASRQYSQESDETAIFAEIKQLYDGVSRNGAEEFNRPPLRSDVNRPDELAPRLSAAPDFPSSPGQGSQESDESAIFAEIKRLYDGVSQNGPDEFRRPSIGTDVNRRDDLASRLSAAQDFAPSSRQPSQESDEAATRRKIKELYDSNLRRRTLRYDRASPRAKSGRPDDLAPRLLVAKRDSILRRRSSQTIVGIAILAAIVVMGSYEYHHLGDTPRSMVVKREQRGNGDPAGGRAGRRDMATLKTIPAQNTQRAHGKQKTVVWDPQKVNSFWTGVMGKAARALANLVTNTPDPAAATPLEPTAAPAPEPAL